MTPRNLTSDLLLDSGQVGIMFTNLQATQSVTIRLPFPRPLDRFELLQVSNQPISFHTNHENVYFLTRKTARRLVIPGNDHTYGKCLRIEAFDNYWRISQSTLQPDQLIFEEY